MKHTKRLVLLCSLALSVVSFSANARDFRAADNQPMDYPTVLMMQFMGEQIAKETNGRYNIKVFGNSVLGSGGDTVEQVKVGAIEMTRVSTSEFHSFIPETLVPSFPFLFRDIDHFRAAMYGAPGDQILAAMEKDGFIGLCMLESGTRSIYAKKPVRTLADAKGMKIRVQPSDLWVSTISAMGASATPVPYAEVYMALKTGLVDAAENNYPSYEAVKHYEAAPIYSETQHVMAPDVIVFSKKIWDTLSKEDQATIRKAAKDALTHYIKLWGEKETIAKEAAKKAGATFVDDVNKAEFVTAMKPVWDKFAPTPELKKLVQDVVDSK